MLGIGCDSLHEDQCRNQPKVIVRMDFDFHQTIGMVAEHVEQNLAVVQQKTRISLFVFTVPGQEFVQGFQTSVILFETRSRPAVPGVLSHDNV